tara:strand:+ start:432 stop:1286 length:855 start_codon:yes stop_codon:yes gene_type:complete
MFKVFGFVTKNENLTHDEYRAGHVGYHNSFGRRLNNIRGYTLNVRSNQNISEDYISSSLVKEISFNEPIDFDNQWNGYGQLIFNKFEDYITAKQPALDKAGPNGLELDEMVAKVGGDFEHLYSGSPFQFNVNESIIVPVMRPEHKLFKVIQFVKKNEVLPEILFNSYLKGTYSEALSKMDGLRGLIINQRTSLDVITNFFNPESECFSKDGVLRRERFYENWDILIEYWFNNSDCFFSSRFSKNLLSFTKKFEEKYLKSSFYKEVDETVAVIPKRGISPDYYFR